MGKPACSLRTKLIALCAASLLACGFAPAMSLANDSVASPLATESQDDSVAASFVLADSEGSGEAATPDSASSGNGAGGAILASSLAPNGASIVSADVALDSADPIIGSFTVDGLTYAVGSDGLALVAVDAAAVSDDTIAIPSTVTYDGMTYPVTAIGPYAFYLSGATDVILPASIASVDDRAFRSSDVERVTVDAENPNLTSFDGALYSADESRLLLIPEGRKGSVLLSCETEVVQASLFSHCSLVEAISVEEGGAAFSSWDGLLYDASGTTLLRVPAGATDITIRDGCTTIAAGAMEGCAKLERINAPATVASISPDVFESVPTVSLPIASALQDSSQVDSVADPLAGPGYEGDARSASADSSGAEGEAEVAPRRVVAESQGLSAPLALPDLGSTSASLSSEASGVALQLTAMVALNTADDSLPEADLSAITVVPLDDTELSLWMNAGFTVKDAGNQEAAVNSIAATLLSESIPLNSFGESNDSPSEGMSSAVHEQRAMGNVWTITLDDNGADKVASPQTFYWKGNYSTSPPTFKDMECTTRFTKLETLPEKKGYTLVGYRGRNDASIGDSTTITYIDDSGVILEWGSSRVQQDSTWTAQWNPITFIIKLDPNGSNVDAPESISVKYESDAVPPEATRSGCTFKGWDTQRDGQGMRYQAGDPCGIFADEEGAEVTLYAQWDVLVTFDKVGGSGGTDSVILSADTAISSIATPMLSGWTFSGYTDDFQTNTYLYVEAGGAGTTRTLGGNRRLYANWTKTVSLNANGGTAGSLISLTAGIRRPLGQKCTQVASDHVDYPIRSLFSKGITDDSGWAPTRAGYTFQGYYDTNASSGGTCYINASGTAQSACNPVTSTMPSTLYARWSKNAIYTITLDSQLWESSSSTTATASATSAGTTAIYYWVGKGWYATASPSDTATAATTATALITQPTLAGYAYGGYWTGKAGTGTQKISGQKLSSTAAVSASATWYAKWTKNAVHAITLDKNGGTGGTSTIYEWYGKGWYATSSPTVSSTAAASITAPTRAGYAYKGYATSSTATSGSYWTSTSTMPSSTAFSAATTLYAVWQKNAVSTVNLYKNAGDTTTLHKTVYLWYGKGWYDTASPTDSSTALTTIGTPSWPGRTYKGFATSSTASAGSYWTTVTSFPSNTSSTFGSATTAKSTSLYAVWQGNEVTLTWEPHNGSAATTTKQTHSTTSTVKVALPAAPTWAGRTFAGWYTAASGGTQVTNATDLPASSTTCHAHWTEDAYVISYDYDGGNVSGNPTTYKVSSATFTLKNPTKTGYTFTGWAGFLVDGAGRPIEPCLEGDGNMEVKVEKGSIGNRLYCANFKANRYTVEWYDFTGENLLITDEDIPYDMSGYEMPSRDDSAWLAEGHITPGYEIVGWANSPRQRTADYSFGATTGPLASVDGATVKLYLAESPKVITLSWVSLGEEFATTAATFSPDAKVPMPEGMPNNDPGWAFMGWWTAEEGGDEVTADTPLPTDDATLYARWVPIVAAAVPIEATARVDLLGLEEQEAVLDDEGYQGYIESRSGEPLQVAEVSFEPLSGAGELFGADVSRVSLQALAEGSTSADYSFALDAAAALKAADGAAEAASLAPFALPDGYGTRKHVTYRFDIPDDVLASIDQGRFEQVTTPIGQVVYTVALAE